MVNGLKLCAVTVCALCLSVLESRGTIVLPPMPLGPDAPVCTSYSSLCNLSYNLTEASSYQVVGSDRQICACPGNQQCETGWHQHHNSVIKEIRNAGHDMTVKMDYCSLTQPSRVCRKNDIALVMRGRGAFVFEVVDDFRCRCYRSLFAHESWTEGDYHYIKYSCGKSRCPQRYDNEIDKPACTRVRYESAGHLRHEYICRCLWNEDCTGINGSPFTPADLQQLSRRNPVLNISCMNSPVRRRRNHRTRN